MQKILESLRNKLQNMMQRGGTQLKNQSPAHERHSQILDISELRRRGLQEIFNFYSRQHIPQNRKFEELEEAMSQIDLGEFMKFCKDFEIPLPKLKIQEVFKKSCVMGHKPLKYEQFDGSLTRLAVEINKVKLQQINQKLKIIDNQIRMNMQNPRGQKQRFKN